MGELISGQQQNERQSLKTMILVFFSFSRLCLEFFSSHCQMSAISDHVLHRDIVQNIIVYLLPNLVRSAGEKRRGGLALEESW